MMDYFPIVNYKNQYSREGWCLVHVEVDDGAGEVVLYIGVTSAIRFLDFQRTVCSRHVHEFDSFLHWCRMR